MFWKIYLLPNQTYTGISILAQISWEKTGNNVYANKNKQEWQATRNKYGYTKHHKWGKLKDTLIVSFNHNARNTLRIFFNQDSLTRILKT